MLMLIRVRMDCVLIPITIPNPLISLLNLFLHAVTLAPLLLTSLPFFIDYQHSASRIAPLRR